MSERIDITVVWAPKDSAKAGPVMLELGPLLQAYWDKGRPKDYPAFGFNVESFIVQWAQRQMALITIRVDGKLVGFIFMSLGFHLFAPVRNGTWDHVYLEPGYERLNLLLKARTYTRQVAKLLDLDVCYVDGRHGKTRIYSKWGK